MALALLIVISSIVVLGLFILWRVRSLLREAKNYERGIKMVPLLIHLPPPSDDVQNEGRDAREIVDENVSRAQVLFNIIASTAQNGFKSKFYGQRHISLEIVAHKGVVHFYAAVPVALVSVIEQAILSAYPNSHIEEVAEHNIFNPIGKLSGTTGGELVLKEKFYYPIATFQDIKRDTIQSLLSSFAKLDQDDGVGIQILIRPAAKSWTKTASAESSKLREGKKNKKGLEFVGSIAKDIFVAPVKAPESKDGGGSLDKPASSLDQSKAESIDEKIKYPGYEVLIRVIVSSNISQRAQTILANINATFALYDLPGKNGFKLVPARDTESFVTAYILRFFPPEHNKNILNSVELATLYHFPDASNIPTTQLERQGSKQVDGPRNMLDEGLMLGYNIFRGVKKPIYLSEADRRRHMYIIGETGTGKTTFLNNIAVQDMLEGRGFAFIDPHGDAAEEILGMVPKERAEDVIYFCPSDMQYPMGLNLFEYDTPDQKDFLIQETINMIYALYDPNRTGMVGARFEHIFRNCALLLMSDPAGGTFVDVPKLLIDPDFVKQKLKYCDDQNVLDFWTKEFPNSQRSNDAGEVNSWVASKFGAFLSNEMMRNIIGQTKSSFNLREIMDQKKIFIVNLSKGKTGDLNSRLLGMMFVMKFQAAAMSRADMPEDKRSDFSLIVDEFQNFSTESFATILSEARKYKLNLVMANQYIGQLSDEIRDAVLGNVGQVVAYRVGNESADAMAKYMEPIFDTEDLRKIPNFNCAVRMLIGGVPTQPFSMAGLPPLGKTNKQLGEAMKQLSAAKYGTPRAIVSEEIFKRLKAEVPSKPSFGASGSPFGSSSLPTGMPPAGAPGAPKPSQPSFLDEWLAKRKIGNHSDKAQTLQSENVDPKPDIDKKISTASATVPKTNDDKSADNKEENSGNISSTTGDNQEVNNIADELRGSMATADIDKVPKQEGEQPIQAVNSDNLLKHNDTIYIDREGNLETKDIPED